jgi:hypothetical protein
MTREAMTGFLDRWGIALSLLLFLLIGIAIIATQPGLQYDEALQTLAAVHLRRSEGPLPIPHDPDIWWEVGGKQIPLMTVRYVGALKEWLAMPLFAVIEQRTEVLRGMSLAMAAIGIWGLAFLLRAFAGGLPATLFALLLAVHPAYLYMTVFDNGTCAAWMMAMGLAAVALTRLLQQPTSPRALWLGIALGFGVWCRANLIWLIVGLAVALALTLRRELLADKTRTLKLLGSVALGGLIGGAPFALYQVISKGGTLEATQMFVDNRPLPEVLATRTVNLAEALLIDREHKVMWEGPETPAWQRWFVFTSVLLAFLLALVRRDKLSRGLGITALVLALFLFLSRMPVAEHHFIVLTPLAIALVAVAATGPRFVRFLQVGFAVIFLTLALHWHTLAWTGLERTGGVGVWSDGINTLADLLAKQKRPDETVLLLDWGFQNNLYVITDGQLKTREVFEATRWQDLLNLGGTFVIFGPDFRQFPEPTKTFLAALEQWPGTSKRFAVRQPDGRIYAEVIQASPRP